MKAQKPFWLSQAEEMYRHNKRKKYDQRKETYHNFGQQMSVSESQSMTTGKPRRLTSAKPQRARRQF